MYEITWGSINQEAGPGLYKAGVEEVCCCQLGYTPHCVKDNGDTV